MDTNFSKKRRKKPPLKNPTNVHLAFSILHLDDLKCCSHCMINVSEFIWHWPWNHIFFNQVLEITKYHSLCSEGLPLLFCQPILLKETYIVRLILMMDDNDAEQRDCPSCIIHTTFSLLSQSVEWSPWSPSHSLLQEPSGKPSAPKVKTIWWRWLKMIWFRKEMAIICV